MKLKTSVLFIADQLSMQDIVKALHSDCLGQGLNPHYVDVCKHTFIVYPLHAVSFKADCFWTRDVKRNSENRILVLETKSSSTYFFFFWFSAYYAGSNV